MTTIDRHVHSAGVQVAVPARTAFEFMADPMKQTYWALGSWERRHVQDDVVVGTSLFDNTDLYVRIEGHEELLLVDYYGGPAPDQLRWVVQSRIIPGELVGIPSDHCLIVLTTWRNASTDDAQWELVYHIWRTEVHLIKGRLEREAAA
jgi:hypothetical protein